MKSLTRIAAPMLALALLAGCVSTKVTSDQPYAGPAIPRPNRIIVDDFDSTPGYIPGESVLAAEATAPMPQSGQEAEVGRQLGAEVARQLTLDLQKMGLPAVQAAGQPPPQPGDLVVKGLFYGVKEGNEAERILVGFGSGAADLRTAVEVYQATPAGLRSLAGGDLDATTGRAPGMVAPVAVFAATHNPIGLVVVGGIKAYGQFSGRTTIEGDAKRTADEIAARFKQGARMEGWI
jgi:hypothetical protein